MIQRKFSIGFQRASRLLDMMEERGIVGPRDGPRPREVLLDPMDVETVLGGGVPYSGPPIEMDPFDDEPTVGS
jgi:S-DNA-T family DNA segregation ATPase FtsK/SpoIIIE